MSTYVKTLGVLVATAITVFYALKKIRNASVQATEAKRASNSLTAGFHTKYMKIPKGVIGVILGRHGSNARQLEFETKTFTQICYFNENEVNAVKNSNPTMEWDTRFVEEEEVWDKSDKPKAKSDQFVFLKIQGKTMESVELAICKVKAVISDWKRNNHVDHIIIPKETVGFLIGKNGKNLKTICHICRVRTNMVSSNEKHEIMEIRGTEEGVQAACDRFKASISRYYRIRSEEEEVVTEFAPDPIDERRIYANLNEELEDLEKLRQILQEEW